jgi:hypothetical protein
MFIHSFTLSINKGIYHIASKYTTLKQTNKGNQELTNDQKT